TVPLTAWEERTSAIETARSPSSDGMVRFAMRNHYSRFCTRGRRADYADRFLSFPPPPHARHDLINSEPELLVNPLVRRRHAKAIQAHHPPSLPTHLQQLPAAAASIL